MKYFGTSITELIFYRITASLYTKYYFLRYVFPNRSALKKTKSLKNTKKGRNAFVFANGPSLKLLDLNKILKYKKDNYDVFAVNSYICSEYSNVVKPDYYVLSDPAYFGFNLHLTEEHKKELEKQVKEIILGKLPLFIPIEYYNKMDYKNKYAFFDAENIFSRNTVDITRPRGYLSMTAYKALAIAYYLGYSSVYICGFDNDYFKTLSVDRENNLYYEDVHFYDNSRPRINVTPNTFGWGDGSIGQALYILHFLFVHLKKFPSNKIMNLDPKSLVDCFSKQHNLDIYSAKEQT